MTSVLDVYVCWKLDLFLHFPIHNFLECTGHQLSEVADWITAKLLTRIPSQTLTYVDAEGDEIVINDVTPSSITEFLEVLLINGYHHVNVQCSMKPRDFTYEEFPFYGLVQVPEYFSRFQHLNKEETAQKLFLLEMRDIEEKQNILKEEAKRSLEQQAAVLRSYGQTVQVNTDFSCDIRYAEDGLCRHECKNAKVCFLNRDTKEVKSNSEEKKPHGRPLRLFIRPNQEQQNTTEKLERRFFEDALKQYPPVRHESPRSRIADFLAELTAVSETKSGMSLCSGETHNVKAEKVHSIAQTQTDKVSEGKHIQTEADDSDDTSAEMSTVMYDLFANGAFRSLRKRTNSSKKCEMKRSTDSKKEKVKDSPIVDVKQTQKKDTPKTVLPDQKISQDRINTKASGPSSHDRPRVSIIKEGALRKTLSDCGQLEYVTKSFRIHNIGKTALENIKVKLIRFTPGVEECNCTNYVQSFSMRPDSTHRVTLNVTVKAKRTEPCVASFFVTAENGMVASPYLHVVVHPNIEETDPKKHEAKKLREAEQQTTTEQREAAQQTIAAEKTEIEIQTIVSLKKEAEQQTVHESIEVKTAIPVFPIQSLQQRAALVVQQSTLMIAGKPTQLALPSPSARLALGAPEVRLAIQQTSEDSSESVDFESWFVQKDNSCGCESIKQKNELTLDVPRTKSSSEMIALGVEEAKRLLEEKDDDVMTAIGYDDEDEVKTAIPYEVDVYDELEITVATMDDDVHTAIGYEDEDEVKTAIPYEEDCELRTAVAYEEGDEVKTAIGLEERNDIDEHEDDEVMTAIAYDEEEERERQLLENGDVEWQVTERDIRQAIYMATRGDLADNDDDVHTAIEAEPELELDETQSSGSSYESYEDGVDALNEIENGEDSDASDFEVISRDAVDDSTHY